MLECSTFAIQEHKKIFSSVQSYDIKNGSLVLVTNYSVSTVEGTGANAVINKYRLTGPGQHVDGPEQIFYPFQPPT